MQRSLSKLSENHKHWILHGIQVMAAERVRNGLGWGGGVRVVVSFNTLINIFW